jgi:outer membrane assembly lipoprotein YfiO
MTAVGSRIRKCGWLLVAALVVATGCSQTAQAPKAPAADKTKAVWKDGKWIITPKDAKAPSVSELSAIRAYLKAGQGRKAIKAAKKFLKRHPTHPGREEAMMLAAQGEMDRGNYFKAFERFEAQLDAHPNGQFFERALQRQYEIADTFLQGRKRRVWKILRFTAAEEALDILAAIASRAPGTVIAEKASLRAADYYYASSRFVEAAQAYDHYLKLFTNSPRAGYAMLQAARATYAQYRGQAYNDTPLIDAQQRFRQYARQYPAAAKRANVHDILKRIDTAIVQRTFTTARFYQRVEHRKAAAFYYHRVVQQYPHTSWARAAADALTDIARADSTHKKTSARRSAKTQPDRSQTPQKPTQPPLKQPQSP